MTPKQHWKKDRIRLCETVRYLEGTEDITEEDLARHYGDIIDVSYLAPSEEERSQLVASILYAMLLEEDESIQIRPALSTQRALIERAYNLITGV